MKRLVPIAIVALALVDCGAPPWQLGKPLDGRPSIPPGQAVVSPARAAADAEQARASGRRVVEITALAQLDAADRLDGAQAARLANLLVERATEFHALGARDSREHRSRDSGAPGSDPGRAAGASPRGGRRGGGRRLESDRRARRGACRIRARVGAGRRQPRRHGHQAPAQGAARRVRAAASRPRMSTPTCWRARRCRRACCRWSPRIRGCSTTRRARWRGPRRCWPRTRRRRTCWSWCARDLGPGRPLRRHGADADGARVPFARSRGGDRARRRGLGARSGARARRARSGSAPRAGATIPEDPVWRTALACARRDPGAGDPKAIRDYVVSRARPDRREAIAAELDGRPPVVDGGAADATTDATAGARRRLARRRRSLTMARRSPVPFDGVALDAAGDCRRCGAAGARRPTSRRAGRPRFARLAAGRDGGRGAVANAVVPGVPGCRSCRGGWTGSTCGFTGARRV